MSRVIAVEWPAGHGPEHHSAFKRARVVDGTCRLDFPEGPGISKSRETRKWWGEDCLLHLASWCVKGRVIEG